jgi:NAD(P) transhydrogenase
MEKFDLIVIGSGPAGEKGAVQAAYFEKRVALIERSPYLGGAGVNTGTVPSKTLREAALYFSGLAQRGLYGIDYSLRDGLSIKDFMHRERAVVESGRDHVARNLERQKITLFHGHATLKNAHTVEITSSEGARVIQADIILIATGSSPRRLPDVPFDQKFIHDSDTILNMHKIPETMVVVGGGVIGTEYASIFGALGVRVTVIDSHDRVLSFVDSEVRMRLMHQLKTIGLDFVLNERMTEIRVDDDRVHLTLQSGVVADFDMALIAAGRQSNVEDLGLEQIGVQLGERGLVLVNENYQTSVPNIFAAGDVIGFPALASTSMEQGRVAVAHALQLDLKEHISSVLPLAVYSIPEISSVGLTEDECRQKNISYLAGRAFYDQNARGQIIGDSSGMVKLIFSPADKKLLGVHIIGEQASELIHIGSHIMMIDGTIDAFTQAVYNYPTLADLYKAAAYDGIANLDPLTGPAPF